eukprot:GSMAST32.ASY1.ANO1.531.1 assembled CDS
MANSDATPLLFNPMVFCKFELLPVKMASKDKSGIASKKIVSECVDSFSLVDDSLSAASLDTISAPAKLHRCFLEILWHVVGELFTPKVAVSILEFACNSKKEGIMTLLVDVLWLVACQCRAALGNSSDGMTRLSCLINLLASQGIISKDLAQERLDLYILESSNLIPSRNAIHKKLVKSNTKQLYTQSKFNLLREETEGYSKLITALNQDINYKTLPAVKKNIRGLIGQFFLDPNRVFDLVLESYENNLSNPCYNSLVSLFKEDNIVHVLGFKFQCFANAFQQVPVSLCRLSALLLAQSKLGVNGAGQNSKFRLLVGALDMRCWSLAVKLLRRFESLGIDATDDKDVLLALIRLVNYLIEPIYNSEISCVNVRFRAQSEIPSIKPRDTPERFDNLASTLLPVLSEIGPLVARDIKLYTKLCRLMQLVDPEESKCMRKIVSDILLPGLSLVGPNPAVVSELWLFFSQFSCSERYDMYGKWHAGLHILGSHPLMHRIRKKTEYATKTVLKRLALETVRLVGRQIGKLSHSNPLHVFQTIIMRIEAFDNLIQPVVDSLRYLTPMAADCLVCVLFITTKLKANESVDLCILQQLLARVAEIVSRLPLPSLSSLILDYNVSPAAAFNMCRSSLRRALQVKDDKSSNACLIPWQPFANPMINAIRTIFADQWNSLSPELYMTFWTYELYDIYVPETLYQSRIKSIKDRIAALANKPVSTFGKLSSEVKAEEKLRRKTNDNLSSSLSKLKRELAAQQACSRVVLQSMNLTKSNWLCNISDEKDSESISEQIVRRLLFPRLKYSPAGASYSAKFILLLHNLNTPSFSTTKCLEICFNALPATVLCLSECEAGNLGIFLKEIFQLIKSWRSSTKLFGLGAQSKVGFLVEPSNSKNKTKLTYVQFKKLSQKWYDRVAQVMMQCLDSSDYMQIRNGLIVLLKISEIFPWCYKTSALLEKYTAKLVDAEEREDLRIMASRYHATLSKLLKGFKPAVGDVVAKSNSKKGRSTRKNSSSERAVSGNGAMQSSSRLKDREDGKRRDGDDRRRDGPKRDDRRDDRRDGPRRDGPRRDDRRDGPRRDGPKRDDRRDGPKRNRDDPRGSYRKDMNNVGRATLDREKNIRGDKDRRDRSRSRERPNTNNFKRDRGRDRDKDSNPKVGSKRSRETVVNANKSKGISFSSNRPVKRHRSMNNGNTSNMNSSKRDRGNNSPVPPSSNSRSQKQNSNRTSLNTESALRLKLEKAKQDKLKTRPKSPRRSPRANGRENKKDAEKHRESSKKSSRDNRDGGRQNSRRQSGGRKSLGVNGDGNRNGKKKVSPNNRGNRNNRNRR